MGPYASSSAPSLSWFSIQLNFALNSFPLPAVSNVCACSDALRRSKTVLSSLRFSINFRSRETTGLLSGPLRMSPKCCRMSSFSHSQQQSVLRLSSYRNSSSSDKRAATFSVAIEARVFLRVLGSDSAMISLRRGRSLVVMACSTTVLYDSVLASRCGRVGKCAEGGVWGADWKGLEGCRDSSITRPQDFIRLLIRLTIIIHCHSNPIRQQPLKKTIE